MLPSKLLISLKSAEELRLIADFHFPWIDLKDPAVGSIGCPNQRVVADFIEASHCSVDRHQSQMSLAMGELHNDAWRQIIPLTTHFDFIKIGLAGCQEQADWANRIESLADDLRTATQLILVHYADYRIASAPPWRDTLETASRLGSKYLLIDTFEKAAGRLWDWYSPGEIHALAVEANQKGIELSIAGSLKMDELPMARTIGASIIGIRGAACQDSSRVNALCHDRLRMLSEIFSKQSVSK